jgi:hypothetical protein
MINTFAARLRNAAATVVTVATIAGGLLGTESAFAHHSFSGFDQSRKVTVTGTVKEWQFTNPHSWLQLIVMEDGQPVEYNIEGASVSTLVRRGWTTKTFKAGEKITVEMYPWREGTKKSGALLKATFQDGKTITSGITPN